VYRAVLTALYYSTEACGERHSMKEKGKKSVKEGRKEGRKEAVRNKDCITVVV
jgi:hypothetical protein